MTYATTKQEDRDFLVVLLGDIPYFHQLYAKYKDPKWLAHAKETGELAAAIKSRIDQPWPNYPTPY